MTKLLQKSKTLTQNDKVVKGATGLYKPVGGARASFCIISNMLHIRDYQKYFSEYV